MGLLLNDLLDYLTLHKAEIIVNSAIGFFTGFVIFLIGIYIDQIRSFLKRDLYWLGFILGRHAVQRGITTVTIDTYSDIRLLRPEIQKELGISAPAPTDRRFYKIFPNGHITWFPGAWDDIMGYCSARAASYLVDTFSPYMRKKGLVVKSDREASSSWEGTFINLGSSSSNIKTDDLKHHHQTKWYEDDMGGMITLKNDEKFTMDDGYDKGMILKMRNHFFSGYSSIICAGLGEWGTSGAAWFLARYWRTLAKRYKNKDFILIVSVRQGSDESAQQIYAASDPTLLQTFGIKVKSFFNQRP